MSMINEELKKRTGQKPASLPSVSEVAAGFSPVDDRPRGFPVLTLFIVLIPLIAIGLWFLVKGLQMDEQPKNLPAETVLARVPEADKPMAIPAPVVVVQPTNAPVATPMPAGERVYKLQGIYWRPSRPSAVVNGKTVFVGDRVETARVTAIDQESVTLSVEGQSKTLLIP